MNELILHHEYNQYPDIITYDKKNPKLRSPYATNDLFFNQTRETFMDIDNYRNFIRNCETRFRASAEYKAIKSYLIEYNGIDRCQIMGNITVEDAEIELHHNIIGLFDICILISSHIVNTVGMISSFDLIQHLVEVHKENIVPIVFLCKTAHQMFTNDPEAYIGPEMTYGRWWELLERYKYGITYDIANKVVTYLRRAQENCPPSVQLPTQEQILSWAMYNETCESTPLEDLGALPNMDEFEGGFYNYEFY